MRENISVLIPWRGGDPQREVVWEFIKQRWLDLGVELCVGIDDHGAPFNCSRALNRAFKLSTKSILMQFGADCIPDVRAIDHGYKVLTEQGEQWVPLFDRTDYFNAHSTTEILRGISEDACSTDPELAVPFQTGTLGFTRQAFIEVGGSDERFSGWGGEDAAFRMALYRLYGDVHPLPYTLRCLWHDSSHRRLPDHNMDLCREYEAITDRVGMVDLIARRGYYV
jgi:hypothetical protein